LSSPPPLPKKEKEKEKKRKVVKLNWRSSLKTIKENLATNKK